MAYIRVLVFVIGLVVVAMDHLSKVDKVKFQDRVKFCSDQNPRIANRSDYDPSREAVVLKVPRRFLLDLHQCHQNTGFSYTSLLNAHINIITICNSTRLESHLEKVCSGINAEFRRLKQATGPTKREAFLKHERKISLYSNELVNTDDLVIANVRFQEEIVKLRAEYDKVLSTLQSAYDDLQQKCELQEKDIEKLTEKNAELANYIKEKCKIADPTNKGGDIFSVKYRQKKRKLDKLTCNVNATLWFAKSFGLVPEFLKLRSPKNGTSVTLNLTRKTGDLVAKYDDLSYEDKDKIQQLTLVLDRFGVGEKAYHELRIFSDRNLPTSSLIEQCRHDVNQLTEIKRLPGKKPGAYVSFSDEVTKVIESDPSNLTPRIKFCGDGTKVSRIKNYVVFSYCKIDGDGPHKLLGILQGCENYKVMKESCALLIDEVNEMIEKGLDVEGTHYSPEIFLGGDLKFILTVQGMNVNCSTANHCCPFCIIHKDHRGDTSKDLNFYHGQEWKRNFKTHCEIKNGQKEQPLVKIDIDHIVPCLLHGLLRVMDVLERNLILEMVQRDARAKIDGKKEHYLNDLIELIRSCGVSYNVWEVKEGKKTHESTALTGGAKLKVLENLPDKLRKSNLLYEKTKDKICSLWEGFLNLYIKVNHSSSEDASDVFDEAKVWIQTFHGVGEKRFGYSFNNTTPYMHIFLYHFPHYLEMYGALSRFSGQGMEKLNDLVKFVHHRRTSRWDGEKEALTVGKRMEALSGKARVKRPYNLTDEGRERQRAAKKAKRQALLGESQPVPDDEPIEESDDEIDLNDLTVPELKTLLYEKFNKTTRKRLPHKIIEEIEEEKKKKKMP